MDTVICLNVLEHIEDDLEALRNIRSMLEDGGRAVILVPSGQSIFNSLDEELGHFRRYSEDQLREKMTAAGFDVETILRFNRASRPGWWLNGTVLKRRTISRLQLRNFDRLVWLLRRVDAHLPWPQTSIIGIGRRRKEAPPAQRYQQRILRARGVSVSPVRRAWPLESRGRPRDRIAPEWWPSAAAAPQ